jgi:protein-S-isoprenylcysteine O-methyltransferase Ste14
MTLRTRSVVATLLLVVTLVLLLEGHMLLARVPAAIGLQVAAVALMAWARVTFGLRSFHAAANPTAGGLVTHGPYRYWRHPIYAATLLFVWAGLLGQGIAPSAYALALAVVASVFVGMGIQAEEHLLREAMPE